MYYKKQCATCNEMAFMVAWDNKGYDYKWHKFICPNHHESYYLVTDHIEESIQKLELQYKRIDKITSVNVPYL